MRCSTPPGAYISGCSRICARCSWSTAAAQSCVVFSHGGLESLTGRSSQWRSRHAMWQRRTFVAQALSPMGINDRCCGLMTPKGLSDSFFDTEARRVDHVIAEVGCRVGDHSVCNEMAGAAV